MYFRQIGLDRLIEDYCLRFEAPTAVSIDLTAFWSGMPCCLVDVSEEPVDSVIRECSEWKLQDSPNRLHDVTWASLQLPEVGPQLGQLIL